MFLDVLKELAKKRGMNLYELQSKAGLARGGVYKWKTYTPSIQSLNKLAEALGVTTSYLLRLLEEEKAKGE
mgnify:CR=1 FL=1